MRHEELSLELLTQILHYIEPGVAQLRVQICNDMYPKNPKGIPGHLVKSICFFFVCVYMFPQLHEGIKRPTGGKAFLHGVVCGDLAPRMQHANTSSALLVS